MNREKYNFLRYQIIGAPKKFRNWPRPLFTPITDHTCHQKPNPSRETIPLRCRHIGILISSKKIDWSCEWGGGGAVKPWFYPPKRKLNFIFLNKEKA